MAVPRTTVGFDGAKFSKMAEPLTVRLDRLRGAGKGPEPVAVPFGGSATKEQVMALESWVLEEPGGGYGDYVAQVTDEASGLSMKWAFSHPAPAQAIAPAAGPWPHGFNFGSAGGALGGGAIPAGAQPGSLGELMAMQYQMLQMEMQARAMERMQAIQGVGAPRSGAAEPVVEDLRRRLDEERLARMQAEHRRELDDARRQAAEQIAEIRRAVEQTQKAPATDPAVEELRRTNAELLRRLEAQEASRASDTLRVEMKEMAARFEATVKEMSAARPDPMVDVLREQAKAQAEAAKAQADAQARTAQVQADAQKMMVEKFSSMSTTPEALLRLSRDLQNESGASVLMTNLQQSVGAILALQQQAMKNALDAVGQAQGSPIAGIVAQGINDTKDVIGRYFETKAQREIAAARAQAQDATARIAEANAGRVTAGGLGGAPAQAALPAGEVMREAPPAPGPNGTAAARAQDVSAFGPALNAVARLRQAVADGAAVEQCIGALVGAMQQFEQYRSSVPALALIVEGKYVEFFAVLLPAAPEAYRTECVARLKAMFDEAAGQETTEPSEPAS